MYKKSLDFDFPESKFAVLNLMNSAIIAGGQYTNRQRSNIVREIFPSSFSKELMPLRKAKSTFPMTSIHDEQHIFAIGGYDSLDLSEVEMLDRLKNIWIQQPCLLTAKCASAACSYEPKFIYSFCGNTNGANSKDI